MYVNLGVCKNAEKEKYIHWVLESIHVKATSNSALHLSATKTQQIHLFFTASWNITKLKVNRPQT